MKIRILREAGGLGDVLRTLPVIKGLREKHPDAEIVYYGLPGYRAIVERPGHLSRYEPVEMRHRRDRDGAIDPARWPYLEGSWDQTIDLYCPAFQHEVLTDGYCTKDRTEIFCAAGGVPVSSPRWPVSEYERGWGRGWIEAKCGRRPVVGLAPFSHGLERNWLKERWIELGQGLLDAGYGVLVFDSAGSRARGIPGIPCIGAPWGAVAGLLSNCSLLVSPDTGLWHFAGALGIPALGLFGPTDPEILCRPYPMHLYLFHVEHPRPLQCDPPCYCRRPRGYQRDCRHNGCAVLHAIQVPDVLEAVDLVCAA